MQTDARRYSRRVSVIENPHHDIVRREKWEEGYVHTRRNLGRRRRRMRQMLDAPRAGRFLELGCGDGLNLDVARDLGFRDILGIDYSLQLVLASKVRPVLVGDGHRLPFRAESVTTIFVDSVLHHLTDYPAAANECFRVLAPAGRLYYFEPRPSVWRAILDRVTMSRWCEFVPFFAHRRKTLAEEWDLYQNWLHRHGEMDRSLLHAGFSRRYDKKGPLGMFMSFEKPAA